MELAGKRFLVVGASGELGGRLARALADRGCRVVVAGRDESRTEGIAAELGAPSVELDLLDPVSLGGAVATAAEPYDGLDGLLVATGYSICGASAVAAMAPLSTADEEETAYAIGLVTLCGSLSILVLPVIGHALGLSDLTFGTWVGAGVHDVGQVTATATAYSEASLVPATLVKLTRVILLAPMVFGVGVASRRRRAALRAASADGSGGQPGGDGDDALPEVHVPLVPLFVAGFLGAICLRATGWLSPEFLATAKDAEQIFLTAGMFGLGAGVVISRLRRLGGRPMVLGLVSWVLVAGAALVAAVVIT